MRWQGGALGGRRVVHPGAGPLGVVHGQVRLVQQVSGWLASGGGGVADADAYRDLVLLGDRQPMSGDRPPGGAGTSLGLRAVAVDEQGELVAGEAGDEAHRRGQIGQSQPDGGEKIVAGLVAEGVVDGFEVVEVEQDDAGRGGRGECLVEMG